MIASIELHKHAKILERLAHNTTEEISSVMLAEFLLQVAVTVEHLEKRLKDAEDRHRNLLQSLEDDDLPRP